jgi:hypothetical protein
MMPHNRTHINAVVAVPFAAGPTETSLSVGSEGRAGRGAETKGYESSLTADLVALA